MGAQGRGFLEAQRGATDPSRGIRLVRPLLADSSKKNKRHAVGEKESGDKAKQVCAMGETGKEGVDSEAEKDGKRKNSLSQQVAAGEAEEDERT